MTTGLTTAPAGVAASRPASREGSLPVLRPLTSLRFLAALAVFFSHLGYLRNLDSCQWLCARIFVEGYAGVTFFFVLSGFILTYNYHHVLTGLRSDEIKKFYVARFARIYPLYLLTFLISLPLMRTEIVRRPLTFLYTAAIEVLALQSYVPTHTGFAYNMPAWSLCDEFFFYALLPFILYGLARLKMTTRQSFVALGLGTWLIALVLVMLGRNLASAHWLFYISPPFRLFDFVLGIACGLYFLNTPRINLSRNAWTLVELGCAVTILAMVALSSYYVHPSFRYGVYYMPVFCLTIFVFAHQGGRLSKLLSSNTWVLLGEISFAFYMFHQLVFRYLNELSRGHFGYASHPVLAAFEAFGITLALSYLSFRYYEKFTRDKLKRAFKPKPVSAAH